MGATPEPLLTTDGDQMQTVSLAGTQQASNIAIDEYSWTDKEIEEQEIVTNFVEQVLQESGIQNYTKSKTVNYKAANLIHLKSSFTFEYSTTKNQLSKLIQALHPTPSVGGLPRIEAIQFINTNEKHNRAYYTGFLGSISASEGVNLFVNLRCMQLSNNNLTLYSGAGITASSVPEKEWDETENKLMTLKQVLFSS
jgi:isochorismate synthase